MARILLIPGFWLGAWAWDEVAEDLRGRGDDVLALTLPGLDPADDKRLEVTLEAQARAIIDAVAPSESAVLVAHSGGAAPAYLATDIAPEHFSRVIYIDSGPLPNGFILNTTVDATARELPLPDWERLEADGNSLTGLDDAMLARFRERAVSEPAGIAASPLKLSDSPARLNIQTTVICNSVTADLLRQLRDVGQEPMFSELSRIDAEYIDLPTGHWPMWSKPGELAELIHAVANR